MRLAEGPRAAAAKEAERVAKLLSLNRKQRRRQGVTASRKAIEAEVRRLRALAGARGS